MINSERLSSLPAITVSERVLMQRKHKDVIHQRYDMLKLSSLLFIFSAAVFVPVYAQQADSSMPAHSEGYKAPEALTPDQQAVLKPLQLMCDGLVKKDARLI